MQANLENLKIHKTLAISPAQEIQIAQLRVALQAQCSDNPTAFWKIYKHTVILPYKPGFKAEDIPQRSKAIPMNPEEMELCQKEIK